MTAGETSNLALTALALSRTDDLIETLKFPGDQGPRCPGYTRGRHVSSHSLNFRATTQLTTHDKRRIRRDGSGL